MRGARGSARVEMAGGVYALLHGVGGEGALIIPDDIVRQADGALEARVCTRVPVPVRTTTMRLGSTSSGG